MPHTHTHTHTCTLRKPRRFLLVLLCHSSHTHTNARTNSIYALALLAGAFLSHTHVHTHTLCLSWLFLLVPLCHTCHTRTQKRVVLKRDLQTWRRQRVVWRGCVKGLHQRVDSKICVKIPLLEHACVSVECAWGGDWRLAACMLCFKPQCFNNWIFKGAWLQHSVWCFLSPDWDSCCRFWQDRKAYGIQAQIASYTQTSSFNIAKILLLACSYSSPAAWAKYLSVDACFRASLHHRTLPLASLDHRTLLLKKLSSLHSPCIKFSGFKLKFVFEKNTLVEKTSPKSCVGPRLRPVHIKRLKKGMDRIGINGRGVKITTLAPKKLARCDCAILVCLLLITIMMFWGWNVTQPSKTAQSAFYSLQRQENVTLVEKEFSGICGDLV